VQGKSENILALAFNSETDFGLAGEIKSPHSAAAEGAMALRKRLPPVP
jgi:hypothetical protein